MDEKRVTDLRQKVQGLALTYQEKEDFTGWFEVIYTW